MQQSASRLPPNRSFLLMTSAIINHPVAHCFLTIAAKANGISQPTLRRARRKLTVWLIADSLRLT
jgi:hypothetical protein